MKYYIIHPPEKLKAFVRFFWVYENNINSKPYIFRSMASGCPEILFHYKGIYNEIKPGDSESILNTQPFSLVHSQSTSIKEFITNENFGIFGAYIYPFALPQLFSLPSYEFNNQTIDLKTLSGQEGAELEEKIMLASRNRERIQILSDFLEMKLLKNRNKDSIINSAVRHIIHSVDLSPVGRIAEKYNYSLRQFERKFKEHSGFRPKLYQRIVRFESTLKEYNNNNNSLTEIAYKCGYYDQSHFINEFRQFSGHHPKDYFKKNIADAEIRL